MTANKTCGLTLVQSGVHRIFADSQSNAVLWPRAIPPSSRCWSENFECVHHYSSRNLTQSIVRRTHLSICTTDLILHRLTSRHRWVPVVVMNVRYGMIDRGRLQCQVRIQFLLLVKLRVIFQRIDVLKTSIEVSLTIAGRAWNENLLRPSWSPWSDAVCLREYWI